MSKNYYSEEDLRMKTKQIELFVLSIAVLLAVGYTIIRFSRADAETTVLLNRILAVGLAIYVGYVYITQLRERRKIDGLLERNDALKHKVAEKEHEIVKLQESVNALESDLASEKDAKDQLDKKLKKALKDWKSEKEKLEAQIEQTSK